MEGTLKIALLGDLKSRQSNKNTFSKNISFNLQSVETMRKEKVQNFCETSQQSKLDAVKRDGGWG